MHTVKQIVEKAREYKFEVHFLFLDLQKAFDTVDHNSLWKSMAEQGCEKEIVRVLQNLYREAKAYIRFDEKGEKFEIRRGVSKTGDPISPNLFTCLLEDIFRLMEWENYGISI